MERGAARTRERGRVAGVFRVRWWAIGQLAADFGAGKVGAGAGIDDQRLILMPNGNVEGIEVSVGGDLSQAEWRSVGAKHPTILAEDCMSCVWKVSPDSGVCVHWNNRRVFQPEGDRVASGLAQKPGTPLGGGIGA